jgi:cardiolipin synthase
MPSLLTEDESMNNWKKDILNIPNLLSLFRLVLIPVYVHIYLNASAPREYWLAGFILAISCLTDMVDGKIARKFNMITPLGKLLDPIADKFTQLVLTICLSLRYPGMRTVLILFLAKEFFQFFAALIQYRRGKALDGALMAGKICTTVLFTSLTGLILFPDLSERIVTIIAIIDTVFLFYAFLHYVFAFFGKHTAVYHGAAVEPSRCSTCAVCP